MRKPVVREKAGTSNEERVKRAEKALQGYALALGGDGDEHKYDEGIVTDLLADLMHWMHTEDMDMEEVIAQARRHFAYEMAKKGRAA